MEGYKLDEGKPRTDLLPAEALEEISKVLAFGAEKYPTDNWRLGMDWRRIYGSILRHLLAFERNEDIDKESGLPHLAHAGCGLLFLLWYYKKGKGNDDRYKEEQDEL